VNRAERAPTTPGLTRVSQNAVTPVTQVRSRTTGRLVVGAVLLAVVLVSWVLTMPSATRMLSFEPNFTQALDEAAAGRPLATAGGLAEVASSLTLAWATSRRWLAILGAPGLVVAAITVAAPTGTARRWCTGYWPARLHCSRPCSSRAAAGSGAAADRVVDLTRV